MGIVTFELVLDKEHLIVRVPKYRPDFIYIVGKTRAQVFSNVKYSLATMNVRPSDQTINAEVDRIIWNHVPKHMWYDEQGR